MLLGSLFITALAAFLPATEAANSLQKRTLLPSDGNNQAFIGCYNDCSTWGTHFGKKFQALNGDECADLCMQSKGKGFSYFRGGQCRCSISSPQAYIFINIKKDGYAHGLPNQCPGAYWDVRMLRTKYQFKGCAQGLSTRNAQFSSVRDKLIFKEWFICDVFRRGCSGSQYMVTHPSNIGICSSWNCFSEPTQASGIGGCDQNTFYIYTTGTGGPAPSGLRKRETIDPAVAYEESAATCNQLGWENCYISAEDQTHFECTDTQNEAQRCGGCLHGSFRPQGNATVGVDCTATLGPNAQCIGGKCFA
ncbi:hypothetical protein A1Q2_01296 [Trichosporon asahii var. asahii CBS 8904]|uniref:Delayed-type hypersensitivity antigen-related protein n=2 Tax=Trichosporon asahii var. asahii TaxID=189963 RepID=K1VY10_TRIAC|nr:hypothetical protein A1Q1_04724 [Trichosporon asahii var. asahii CBS 2479]EJT46653.1 hypothetical protein A1Q1_04724 [Trichosporon asahii var. asahii CBS 2479]EKD04412.1 hypothetical protein A1Q2_01296 [Trichosporon asahii var. asahii CBS 8904]